VGGGGRSANPKSRWTRKILKCRDIRVPENGKAAKSRTIFSLQNPRGDVGTDKVERAAKKLAEQALVGARRGRKKGQLPYRADDSRRVEMNLN